MGMFDTWKVWSDNFKEGEHFTLQGAKVGPTITTDYGQSSPSLLLIDGQWYSIFGAAILAQVQRADPESDFPMRVRIERVQSNKGNPMKILVPEGMNAEDFINSQRKARGQAAQDFQRTGNSDIPTDDKDDIPF